MRNPRHAHKVLQSVKSCLRSMSQMIMLVSWFSFLRAAGWIGSVVCGNVGGELKKFERRVGNDGCHNSLRSNHASQFLCYLLVILCLHPTYSTLHPMDPPCQFVRFSGLSDLRSINETGLRRPSLRSRCSPLLTCGVCQGLCATGSCLVL